MTYYIRTNVGSAGFEEIPEEYFQQLRQSYSCLVDAYQVEQKFDLVSGNFLELEADVHNTMMDHMVGRYPGWVSFLDVQLVINRRLANLLSACKTYFDQVYRHVDLCFKEGRTPGKDLKEYAGALYKKNLDYRFMEALRNHVQHYSLAVHSASVGGRQIIEKDERKVLFGVGFKVYRSELANNRKFKATVLKEIGEEVDVISTVRGYINCINLVQLRARSVLTPVIEEANTVLLEAAGGETPSGRYLAPIAIKAGENENDQIRVPLRPQFYEEIMKLRQKNPASSKFESGYFTSSPIN